MVFSTDGLTVTITCDNNLCLGFGFDVWRYINLLLNWIELSWIKRTWHNKTVKSIRIVTTRAGITPVGDMNLQVELCAPNAASTLQKLLTYIEYRWKLNQYEKADKASHQNHKSVVNSQFIPTYKIFSMKPECCWTWQQVDQTASHLHWIYQVSFTVGTDTLSYFNKRA